MSTLRAEDREAFRVAAHNTLKNGVPGEIEYFQYLYNNERFQVVSRWEVSARDETGKVVEISGITQDITSLRAAQERVAYRQRFHGPTGLPNQNIAFDRLAYLLGQARAGSLRLSVVGIRIKNYKALRDSVPAEAFYGALKAAVRSTQDMSRDIDLVARLENGTFVVFSREEKLPTGGAVAQAVQDRWARAVASLGSGVAAEVRTTVVTVPDEGTDAEAVVKLMAFRLTQL